MSIQSAVRRTQSGMGLRETRLNIATMHTLTVTVEQQHTHDTYIVTLLIGTCFRVFVWCHVHCLYVHLPFVQLYLHAH
jgi:hypothetical protein